MDAQAVFALVLSGHPDLERLLDRRGQEGLAQQLAFRHHLVGMEREEVQAYLAHHLSLGGVNRPVLSEEAVLQIFQATQGVARRVNLLALRSLEVAFLKGADLVDGEIAEMAAVDTTSQQREVWAR